MTNFIIKITAITSLFILMCSFTDNSVKPTSLDMPEENLYYKTDYSFVHQDTGKNIHVNSGKENNIIFL